MANMLRNFIKPLVAEPWLAFNRVMTVRGLGCAVGGRRRPPAYAPAPGSLLYVAASCLPYHISGYTTRTHEVIRALRGAGGEVHALTRPGYPWDRRDRLAGAEGEETLVNDVRYHHANHPLNNRPVLQYALQAAPLIARIAARRRAAVIHAASNHVNALPALLAARRLGIPFQYEMRGLWELTRISRTPAYEGSQAYKQGLQLEALVARHADRLFVISEQLGSYVQSHWGIDADRIGLLPNCVDPDRFALANRQSVDANTIGYAGSLIGYEGLDTLIEAAAMLVRTGNPLKVTIMGDGEARQELEALAQRLGVSDRVCFLGKMAPEAARATLGQCALVCIPRKPFKVCEIVPPIKLVEAFAMGKPVVVPDLPVFRDEMGDAPPGWFFRAGDAADLARVLQAALADRATLGKLGDLARTHAATKRRWDLFVPNVLGG